MKLYNSIFRFYQILSHKEIAIATISGVEINEYRKYYFVLFNFATYEFICPLLAIYLSVCVALYNFISPEYITLICQLFLDNNDNYAEFFFRNLASRYFCQFIHPIYIIDIYIICLEEEKNFPMCRTILVKKKSP